MIDNFDRLPATRLDAEDQPIEPRYVLAAAVVLLALLGGVIVISLALAGVLGPTTGASTTSIVPVAHPSLVARALTRVGQWLCGVRGHDRLRHVERARVMLRCTSCGHDSPGFAVDGPPPRPRFAGDPRRHALTSRASGA